VLSDAPWLYGGAMRAWARWPRLWEAFTARNAAPFERAISDAIERTSPDLIVSTYNLAGQCLGRLAARTNLHARTVTLVTDPGAHPYWVSRHVELHLASLPQTAARLRHFGAAEVAVTRPVVRREFAAPHDRAEARDRLGLADDRPVTLINGGSWAAGGLLRTVEVVQTCPDVLPVVLCGRDVRMRRDLFRLPGVRAIPWTDRMADYLAAADVLIDNAGGLTCWEALACRTRVVLFRPLPGHGRCNAAALDEAGLAPWARNPSDLLTQLRRAPAATPKLMGRDVVDVLLGSPRSAVHSDGHQRDVVARAVVLEGEHVR
jgi:UDP-N-acetylglucosamine:LPS N-acetylglucosamine transferase